MEARTEGQSPTVVTHRQLREHSHLRDLPLIEPDVPLHSLEKTGGERTIIQIGEVEIGGPEIILMAGPCALEDAKQIWDSAEAAKAAGAKILRGGAFKPRTSPYSFQGMGEVGLKLQRLAADQLGMLVVTEATGERNVDIVAQYADIIQIGARNAQSFDLLAKIGKTALEYNRAVLYKRGPSMSLQDWMWGAEYILATGCTNVILCERGTMMPSGSVDFDDAGVRAVRTLTHLPIIGDPTHATKKSENVPGLAKRAIEANVDGLLIEIHPKPEAALCDGARALLPETLLAVANGINDIAPKGRYFGVANGTIIYENK